jgi:hypothetical protein
MGPRCLKEAHQSNTFHRRHLKDSTDLCSNMPWLSLGGCLKKPPIIVWDKAKRMINMTPEVITRSVEIFTSSGEQWIPGHAGYWLVFEYSQVFFLMGFQSSTGPDAYNLVVRNVCVCGADRRHPITYCLCSLPSLQVRQHRWSI